VGDFAGHYPATRIMPEVRIATYNIHGWVDADNISNLDRVVEVVNKHDPDILCLQEVYPCWELPCLLEFLRKSSFEHCVRWEGCAVLSKGKFNIREYGDAEDIAELGGSYHNPLEQAPGFACNRPRYVTVQVMLGNTPLFFLTCLHLLPMYSKRRLEEIERIYSDLKPLFKSSEAQVWAGDFNTLTQSDYSRDEWQEIVRKRRGEGRESPNGDVTNIMDRLGFQDSWIVADKPSPRTTSRFDTRVDYVFTSETFDAKWVLKSLIHSPHDASDHSFVMSVYSMKEPLIENHQN